MLGAILCIPLVAGCRPPAPPVTVGVAPDGGLTLRSQTAVEIVLDPSSRGFDSTNGKLAVQGAVGETVLVGMQLQVETGRVHALGVSVGDLWRADGARLAGAFRLFRVHAVATGRRPGWHVRLFDAADWPQQVDDVVVPAGAPIGGLPAAVDEGGRLHVLAELTVPPETLPGDYVSAVSVIEGADVLGRIPLCVTVLPLALPSSGGPLLLSTVDLSQWNAASRDEALHETVRLLKVHGVSPVLTRAYPITKLDRNGHLEVDWTDFDRCVGPVMDEGAAPPAWCRIPLDEHHWLGMMGAPRAGSDELVVEYLRVCGAHFSERGWLARSFVAVPDQPVLDESTLAAIRRYAGSARQADRRLTTLTTATRYDLPEHTWAVLVDAQVHGWIDVWCPPAQFCDPAAPPAAQRTWMTVDRPPYSGTLAPVGNPTFARVLPWQGRRYGVSHVLVGPAIGSSDGSGRHTRASSGLLYPGEPYGLKHPVASMRLKQLRRGLEDVGYLSLLIAHGAGEKTELVENVLTPFALTEAYDHHVADVRGLGWVPDDAAWEEARRVMAAELTARIEHSSPGTAALTAMTADWGRLLARANVGLFVEGVRVRPGRALDTFRVECWLRIENHTSAPLDGTVAFGEIPIGWRPARAPAEPVHIAPLGRGRTMLQAETSGLAWNVHGTATLPIVLHDARGDVFATTARLCHIRSLRCPGSVVIDGDLTDWPTGAGNVAADFVPVSGAPTLDRGEPPAVEAPVAPLPVRCVVMNDDRFLYFGVCEEGTDAGSVPTAQSNTVRYEDMVPVGQDSFEILLDPTNAGTHAPEDLYHILIREGGMVIERGIDADPPIGRRAIWAADVRFASRKGNGQRVTEVRVPLDALGEPGGLRRIWGVNFARFDETRREYTTWSGARHNVYDPMSLGNITIPGPAR